MKPQEAFPHVEALCREVVKFGVTCPDGWDMHALRAIAHLAARAESGLANGKRGDAFDLLLLSTCVVAVELGRRPLDIVEMAAEFIPLARKLVGANAITPIGESLPGQGAPS